MDTTITFKIDELLEILSLRGFPKGTNGTSSPLEYKIAQENSRFQNTPYYYTENKLLHFTSLTALCEILNSSSLRLYTVNNCNDTLELEYWKKTFRDNDLDFYKNYHILSSSFTQPGSKEDLTLWRLYGDKGQGVCIEFSIENDPSGWKNFLLSPIQYQKDNQLIERFTDARNKIREEGFDFTLDISPIIPFFKSSDWELEKEIRMIYYNGDACETHKIIRYALVKPQGKVYYITYPLNHNPNLPGFNLDGVDLTTIPKLSISKIYTGFPEDDERYESLLSLVIAYGMKMGITPPEVATMNISSKIR